MTQARIKLDKLDTKTLAHLYKIKTSHFEYYELPWNQNILMSIYMSKLVL